MATPIISGNGRSNLADENVPPLSEFIRATDEAEAFARPAGVEKFWLEDEYEAAQLEQKNSYRAKGESESRKADTTASALNHAAEKARKESDEKHRHAEEARQGLKRDETVLGPHARRAPDAKGLKWGRWLLLLGGDIVGVSGAALLLGEEPFNAVMQAVSAAASAVTLGGVGREVRYMLNARIRQKDPAELSDEEKPYADWFRGPDSAATLIKIVVLVCAAGILLIGGGIFALRGAAEGLLPAIAFGCLALALGLASFYNSFDTSDDIAEHLDSKVAQVKKVDRAAAKAREDGTIQKQAAAVTEAKSIRDENEAAGEAAANAIERAMYNALGNSPGVAGNGRASSNGATNGNSPNGHRSKPKRAQRKSRKGKS